MSPPDHGPTPTARPARAEPFAQIRAEIIADPLNAPMRERGYPPLFVADPHARIVIIGQAPGLHTQLRGRPWDDASGVTLRRWLGVTEDEFRDPERFAVLPMDFFFPGKGTHGDLPPRRGFAERWHPRLLALMPEIELTLLVGAYAQRHVLGKAAKRNLTETVRHFRDYLPDAFPLVHPSPLNFRWQAKHPWFESEVVPALQERVREALTPRTTA